MKLRTKLEGNNWVVYNDEEELRSFDRSVYGDEIARKMADIYEKAFQDGYAQAQDDNCEYSE